MDFAELKYVRANITTIRLMDPLSFEVTTAVQDWRLDEKRNKGYTEIYADRIKTQTALFYDAVKTFLTAFREFNAVKNVRPMPLQCNQPSKWGPGLQIIENLNQVSLCIYIHIPTIECEIFTVENQ